jgi:hypothetical protein
MCGVVRLALGADESAVQGGLSPALATSRILLSVAAAMWATRRDERDQRTNGTAMDEDENPLSAKPDPIPPPPASSLPLQALWKALTNHDRRCLRYVISHATLQTLKKTCS